LPANWNKTTFKQYVSVQFNKTISKFPKISGLKPKEKEKEANISRIFPPIPPQLSRSILEKSKFFKINQSISSSKDKKPSYVQAFKGDINDIIKIKDIFPKLLVNKVLEIQKIINNLVKKDKPKINMTTKGPF